MWRMKGGLIAGRNLERGARAPQFAAMKPHPRTRADQFDRASLYIGQPVAAAMTTIALLVPVSAAMTWAVMVAIVAVVLVAVQYLEAVWSYAQPHAHGRRGVLTLQLVVSGVLMIAAFAAIYRHLGILNVLDRTVHYDLGTAVYFAIITTATVGYGDFVPTTMAQPFAAAHALMSLIWTGLFFGMVVSSLWASNGPKP